MACDFLEARSEDLWRVSNTPFLSVASQLAFATAETTGKQKATFFIVVSKYTFAAIGLCEEQARENNDSSN